MALWVDLAGFFTVVGWTGAGAAVIAAAVAAVAFALVGSPSSGGLATAAWLAGVMLSLGAGFIGHWTVPVISAAALPALFIGTTACALLRAAWPVRRTTGSAMVSPATSRAEKEDDDADVLSLAAARYA